MRVAVGLIRDVQGRFLITQRPLGSSHAGYWEFPGGKIEAGEEASEALARELFEEVGLQISKPQFLGEVVHRYDERVVELQVFLIQDYQGEPVCKEGQTGMFWLELVDLDQYRFPAANQAIVKLYLTHSNLHVDSALT